MYKNCPLVIHDREFSVDLIAFPFHKFDLILGMDWLSKHRVIIECDKKTVVLKCSDQWEVMVHVSHPQPPPRRMKGTRNYTGTFYLLFQTLVVPSLITKSKYHIQRYKNKTTTVVVFTVSIHTVLSPIYIYIYKNCAFTFT